MNHLLAARHLPSAPALAPTTTEPGPATGPVVVGGGAGCSPTPLSRGAEGACCGGVHGSTADVNGLPSGTP